MRKISTKITAAIFSLTLALSLVTTTSATQFPEKDTYLIDGYTCYEKNGNDCTVIDGKEYIVISINENELVDYPETYSEKASHLEQVRGLGSNWPMDEEDISDGSTYNGSGDITNSDHYTPMFIVDPIGNTTSLAIYMGFIFNNFYNVTVSTYIGYGVNMWSNSTINIGFNALNQTNILLTGTVSQSITKAGIRFNKESTGEKVFSYSIYQT